MSSDVILHAEDPLYEIIGILIMQVPQCGLMHQWPCPAGRSSEV